MEVRETPDTERLGSSVPRAWIGRHVEDANSGRSGRLMDVTVERKPGTASGRHEVAWIRGRDAQEFTIPAARMRRPS
ncbi:hypothetical protein ACFVGY_17425 [Streptomyces sp. NPDC127106]|uniref:hypothetical protein n=1 Tax=Streptomyces sp. NPDC127106 TaxID=3345360 RepID=UPI00363DEE8C